jgi:hypothetical protein
MDCNALLFFFLLNETLMSSYYLLGTARSIHNDKMQRMVCKLCVFRFELQLSSLVQMNFVLQRFKRQLSYHVIQYLVCKHCPCDVTLFVLRHKFQNCVGFKKFDRLTTHWVHEPPLHTLFCILAVSTIETRIWNKMTAEGRQTVAYGREHNLSKWRKCESASREAEMEASKSRVVGKWETGFTVKRSLERAQCSNALRNTK